MSDFFKRYKGNNKVKALSLLIYACYPFVYISMYLDFTKGTMLGYLIMVIGTSILAYFTTLSDTKYTVSIGNSLSLAVSYLWIHHMDTTTDWGYYFAPVSTNQLLVLVTLLNMIPQLIVMHYVTKSKKNKNDVTE